MRTFPSSQIPTYAGPCSNEHAGKQEDAMWSLIHAAWVCDDQGLESQAVVCRNLAINMFYKAAAANQFVSERGGGVLNVLILVDLLRRAGRLKEAASTIRTALEKNSYPIPQKILNFQESLVQSKDLSCHQAIEIGIRLDPICWLHSPNNKEAEEESSPPKRKRWWQFWK